MIIVEIILAFSFTKENKKSRTSGPFGLLSRPWLWPARKDLRSLLLGNRRAHLVSVVGDSRRSRIRRHLSL